MTQLPAPALRLKKGFLLRGAIAQLFKYELLFQPFIILDLYLQHMESLTEIIWRQAISPRMFHFKPHDTKLKLLPSQHSAFGVSPFRFYPWD